MQNNDAIKKRPHSLSLDNRNKGLITGVSRVISANETGLSLDTSQGGLTISGNDLKINRYDMDSGALSFEGTVNNIKYSAAKVSFLKRMFS